MEIFAAIMIIASVVLPVLFVVAFVAFFAMLAYSWFKDLRTVDDAEPTTSDIPVPSAARVAIESGPRAA
jgi:hypothetical protein